MGSKSLLIFLGVTVRACSSRKKISCKDLFCDIRIARRHTQYRWKQLYFFISFADHLALRGGGGKDERGRGRTILVGRRRSEVM